MQKKKKLAIFCDGTWNDLRMKTLTNVARLAKCVASETSNGVPQIVYYDEGVGVATGVSRLTNELTKLLGGAFGNGLDQKIEAAYRFLVSNYNPGDDIYIFGFSRGAYTARSLCGLVRKCGILKRSQFDKTPRAMELYRNGEHPSAPAMVEFRRAYAHEQASGEEDHKRLGLALEPVPPGAATDYESLYQYRPEGTYRMMYLGVWDTVGSMGVPERFGPLNFLNKKYQFHDTNVSSLIASVRHAVSIDEDRRVFGSTGMDNIGDLNRDWTAKTTGWDVQNPQAPNFVPYSYRPYQQLWFPGDHGAVGGGNAQPGLSSRTLIWIAEGAERMGLHFRWTCPPDEPALELELAAARLDPCANWRVNKDGSLKKPKERDFLGKVGGYRPRPGPRQLEDVSDFAWQRWCRDTGYRPENLSVLKGASCPPPLPPRPPAGFPPSPPSSPP
ncbi:MULTISPECIES: DUF2235 domain-containing protein [Asticcacaulis]|uniref:DUF2235 domain-containing protein n=1 Tax=Asticcacaulis TaxID=76890 RepID=UPI001AEB9FDB|nr:MULTISPECIES: DUF2235 domain-containing protein [Asticcacaulis]MBP2161264.1 uncharacterized protein (DUF2235 family) [Asticcacaulis solisilvae]MDR6802370.1 uncharacterized protein (DUF2235 family) [Asticcacaulis sp. BE141]